MVGKVIELKYDRKSKGEFTDIICKIKSLAMMSSVSYNAMLFLLVLVEDT